MGVWNSQTGVTDGDKVMNSKFKRIKAIIEE